MRTLSRAARGILAVAALASILVASTVPGSAQDTGQGGAGAPSTQPSQGAQGSLLPEINPQDIEIRSQFKARFPGVTRQPILGFKPRPRVYQVDPNRMPYLENDDEIRANLPVSSLSRPEAPPYAPFRRPDASRGAISLGAGSLGSPELIASAGVPLGGDAGGSAEETSWLTASLDLATLDAYPANPRGGRKGGDLDVLWTKPVLTSHETKVGLGATLGETSLFRLSDAFGLAAGVRPVTRHQGVDLHTGLGTVGSIRGWDSALDVSFDRHELDADAGDPLLDADMDELALTTRVVRSWPGPKLMDLFSARLEAGFRTGNPSKPGAASRETLWFRGGMGLERLYDYKTAVEGQASLLLLNHAGRMFILPEFDLESSHPLTPFLLVQGGLSAEGNVPALRELAALNPYLNPESDIRHSYGVHLYGEARFSFAFDMQIRSGFRFDAVHNHAGFRRQTVQPMAAPDVPDPVRFGGFYELAYEQAAIPAIYASVTQPLLKDRLWADAGVEYRWPLIIGGGSLPYEESLRLQGSLFAKPLDRLSLKVDVLVMDRRPSAAGPKLDGFVHLAADARLKVFGRWSVYARVDNLIDERYMYWDPAIERPFEIFGGVSAAF